jgi:hypothetical protein
MAIGFMIPFQCNSNVLIKVLNLGTWLAFPIQRRVDAIR